MIARRHARTYWQVLVARGLVMLVLIGITVGLAIYVGLTVDRVIGDTVNTLGQRFSTAG